MINQNKFQERIIQSNYNILKSLKKMDTVNKKLLLVFDKEKFIGVLSIGDIQKAIIANLPLDTCITEIMRKDFLYAKASDDKDSILKLMQEHRIECMPVLDKNRQLVSVYLWDDVFASEKKTDGIKLDLPVIIMAGGQGTRLKPLTNILPKPLIPIGEKTIIEQIMDKFCEVGCDKFYISVNYKAEMIKHYFSTLKSDSYKITFLKENIPLGTAGSLHMLRGKVKSTFFMSNCDILIDQDILDILEYHRATKNEITIVAALKHYPIPYGILETSCEGLLESITEKPEITLKINSGLYILEPNLLNEIPKNEFYHITSLIEKLKKEKRKVGVFPVSEKSWRDIGEWGEYQKFLK
jgi:dTDP-glucose pyrophosphorylase